jgi:hypothetical protein
MDISEYSLCSSRFKDATAYNSGSCASAPLAGASGFGALRRAPQPHGPSALLASGPRHITAERYGTLRQDYLLLNMMVCPRRGNRYIVPTSYSTVVALRADYVRLTFSRQKLLFLR